MPIAIADEEYTHFRNIVKLKTSAYGELDSIPKMCEEQLQRLQSANCTIIDKEFWVFFRLHEGPRKKLCKQYLTNLDKAKITGISLT